MIIEIPIVLAVDINPKINYANCFQNIKVKFRIRGGAFAYSVLSPRICNADTIIVETLKITR